MRRARDRRIQMQVSELSRGRRPASRGGVRSPRVKRRRLYNAASRGSLLPAGPRRWLAIYSSPSHFRKRPSLEANIHDQFHPAFPKRASENMYFARGKWALPRALHRLPDPRHMSSAHRAGRPRIPGSRHGPDAELVSLTARPAGTEEGGVKPSPTTPILAGGALIVAGGLVITFWKVWRSQRQGVGGGTLHVPSITEMP